MTTRTVTEYFRRELALAGYDIDNATIYWSLSYSQGDGMDFAGRVSREGVVRLYSRLVAQISESRNERLWNALCDGAVSVEVSRISSHYHHYNTMRAEVEWDEDYLRETFGFTKRQLSRLEDFRGAVVEDVKDMSKRLAQEGYKLLEACNPIWFGMSKRWENDQLFDQSMTFRTFKRGTFAVQVAMVENREYDGYDGDEDHSEVKRLVTGEVVTYDLRVRILEDGDTVFEEWCHGVSDYRKEIRPLAVARELLSGARSVLRDKADRLARFAGSATPSNPAKHLHT
jgi:hypothetical protein